ncbi:hypothetical protein AVEN_87471-1 [Araneus ventricosus]|uniref:Uncharacterized protein n=1 Tax=Araneus ventricosus TaxID=182803 RepID=A0A4Y2SBV9_ARAVE|nr:hypothetical protein AVEN_87471-1 [Araneus ventricosus]
MFRTLNTCTHLVQVSKILVGCMHKSTFLTTSLVGSRRRNSTGSIAPVHPVPSSLELSWRPGAPQRVPCKSAHEKLLPRLLSPISLALAAAPRR